MALENIRSHAAFLGGDSDMAGRIRGFDWSATVLGSPESWPMPLQTLVALMLGSKQAMCLMWGPAQIFFYNDGYADILVQKHPGALGLPIREVWPEIWDDLKPIVDATYAGKATHIDDMAFTMMRKGYPEEAHFAFSFTPVYGADGKVAGSFMPVVEITERIFADRKAVLEGQRFAQLFEQAPTFMTVLRGPQHVFEYCNPGYMQLIGQRDVIGKPVALAVPEAAGQGYFELLDNVFLSGKAFSATGMKIQLQREPDGPLDELYLDFVYQPIVEADGTVSGIFVEGVNATERIVAEIELRKNEEQLRLATEAGEVGFWDLNHVNNTAFWDARCRALFGVSEDYPVDQSTFYNGLHPEDLQMAGAAFAAAIDPERRANYSVEYRTVGLEDRKIRWVQAKGRGIFSDENTCVRSIGTVIDITTRKQAEIALKELNETLEARIAEALESRRLLVDIVETTDAFIQVADVDFNWLAINRASASEFERIFGIRPKAGDNMLAILAHLPEHQAAVRAIWARAFAGEEFTGTSEYGLPDRDRRAYEMKFNVLKDKDGEIIGAYQFVYDVTERLEAQARLAEAEDHLRQSQKMEAVGQLTGGIAHDFNNMLAVVLGSLELLTRRVGSDDPRTQRQLNAASEAAKRAASLTQRLLAFSRQQPLRPETIDVNKLVSNMSELLRHSIGADIRLETVLAGGVWKISADPNQLESVILNLCVNSRDAMPEGGHLTIETQNAHLDKRYVSSELGVPAGQYVLIAVTDSGTGMPAETVEKAFDPFFTTKEVGKGTGLGLSQVYGFVKQSGGHVKIYSEVGQGTTIKIYLPRSLDTETQSETETNLELAEANREETILVVDDEPAVRQFSVDALMELGYRVLEAESAVTALVVLASHPEIDLLFTDVVMPDTNGRKLADQARQLLPNLKVLYTTGYTRNAVVHNGVLDPGVELIGKPFTLDELAARVRELLDEKLAAN